MTIAGWTLVSRMTGLARVVVLGAVLGPTYFANTFVTTNDVPNSTYTVIAGQVLASVVVPALVRTLTGTDSARATVLLSRVSGLVLAGSAVIAVAVVIVSPALAWTLTFSIGNATDRAQARHDAITLVWLVAPQIVLYTVAALGAAAQQAKRQFALAAAAPAVENIGLVVVAVFAGLRYGTGRDVGTVPAGLLLTLGLGSTVAVGLHAAVQVLGAARVGLLVKPSLSWRSDLEAVEIARRIRGSMGIPACLEVGYLALLATAATVPGGVVVLQLAYSVYVVPTALGARAVSTAVLPRMSAAAQRGDRHEFASAWRLALAYALIISFPALCLLLVFAHPVAEVLANGRLRTPSFVGQLAACLVVIAVSQLLAGVREIGRQALFARIDIRGAQLSSVVSFIAAMLVAASSLLVPGGTARLVMLGFAIMASDLAAASTVLIRLRSAIRPEPLGDRRRIGVAVTAAVAMLPAAAAGWWLLLKSQHSKLADVAVLCGCGLLALASYALAIYLLTQRANTRMRLGQAR